MSRSPWRWWAAALLAASSGLAVNWFLPDGLIVSGGDPRCLGPAVTDQVPVHVVYGWLPVVWYGGVPAVVLGLLATWIGLRHGHPRLGRAIVRVLVVMPLVAYGVWPLGFTVDMLIGGDCVDAWGGVRGLLFFLGPELPPLLAAACMLAATRTARPGGSLRRAVVALVPLMLLAFLPVTDHAPGAVSDCPADASDFVCLVRQSGDGPYKRLPDRELLAFGRQLCEAYVRKDPAEIARIQQRDGVHVLSMAGTLAGICPRAAADLRAQREQQSREMDEWEAQEQRKCDEAPRHRPRLRPVKVFRERTWTDYGVLEGYGDATVANDVDPGAFGSDLLDAAQRDGLVAVSQGAVNVLVDSDMDVCLTGELYRRRPPVETRGWDRVVEFGLGTSSGRIELADQSGGDPLPNLAGLGKGHYRIRLHYRVSERDDSQHLLIMSFPGRSDRTVNLKR
ncbi:hypothetical protein FHR32_000375 [Streptosporangium album]|uniref:Uncharacterized protein n=1 Tax=Streptosporangium album TaxID=47479 RepID=A0A7W7RQ22_9ACTN|nr:hypothetical protein [Streptosporangium album]MBB4936070.1 hypothetical protein [Streptosporangium album]